MIIKKLIKMDIMIGATMKIAMETLTTTIKTLIIYKKNETNIDHNNNNNNNNNNEKEQFLVINGVGE